MICLTNITFNLEARDMLTLDCKLTGLNVMCITILIKKIVIILMPFLF